MSIQLLQGWEGAARRVKLVTGTARTRGDIVILEGRLHVVLDTVTSTEVPVAFYATDEKGITLPKETGAINKGAVVYFDENGTPVGGTATGAVTIKAEGNIRIGRAPIAGASGDATIAVELITDHISATDGVVGLVSKTQLTTAQVLALRATNIELIAAPASGYAIVVTGVHIYLDYNAADYVQVAATDALAVKYSSSTEITELGTEAQMTTFLEASADASLAVNVEADVVPVAATAVDLDNNGAAEWTTGDSTISVMVFYNIVPMAAFS